MGSVSFWGVKRRLGGLEFPPSQCLATSLENFRRDVGTALSFVRRVWSVKRCVLTVAAIAAAATAASDDDDDDDDDATWCTH